MQKIQIIWFKKNLRIIDNQILENISPNIPTIAVYFFEEKIMKLEDFSKFHLKFIFESLVELEKSLKKFNIPLLFISSNLPDGFGKLQKYFDITRIFSHEETGNYATYMRDLDVIQFCKKEQLSFTEFPTNGVVRRLKSRNTWSKIWDERMSENIYISKKIDVKIQLEKVLIQHSEKTKEHIRKQVENTSIRQEGGESIGQKILEDFLENRSQSYSYNIGKPYNSQSSCSRLSPYISYGCLSIKYIFQKTIYKMKQLEESGQKKDFLHIRQLEFFLARIHWQSHFIQKLEDEPEIEYRNLSHEFNSIRTQADTKLIDTVFSAKSGIPYIDATIRQLQQTGWTNFRSRAILVSFLCNTCMQPWQAISKNIATLFTDYEPGIHYPQLQMQAGTTGINTIRIYNAIKNGQEKDTHGNFIRQYLPELNTVPNQYIHEPWKWEGFEKLAYPSRIIDVEKANKQAREILWKTKGNIPKKKKKQVYAKHGSRKKGNTLRSRNKKESKNQLTIF